MNKIKINNKIKSFRLFSTYPSTSTSSTSSSSSNKEIKSFNSIPGPTNEYPYFGSIFELLKEKNGYHIFYENLHSKYGDIVKFKLLGQNHISVSRADLIKEVYLINQNLPLRESLEPWILYRKERNLPLGVTMQLSRYEHDDEEWRKFRRPIAKLLRPLLVSTYIPRVSHVALDFTKTLHSTESKPQKISDIKLISSTFSFEAIGAILMGKSMGVLGKNPHNVDEKSKALMDSVDRMFRTSNQMVFSELPLWRYFNTKSRQEHFAAWDDAFRIGGEIFEQSKYNKDPRFINDGVKDFFDVMDEKDNDDPNHHNLTKNERNIMGIELLLAGVDTTSTATQWILYFMAKHPDIQERIASNLINIMKNTSSYDLNNPSLLTEQHINEAKLYHHIEEILRLYPVLPAGNRLFKKDIVLDGYNIPAYTPINLNNYVASKSPNNFKNPTEYDETRSQRRECPFGSKTFGAGARQCPGERIARMELAVLLGTVLSQFHIVSSNTNEFLKSSAKLLLSPSDDIQATIQFIPRK